MQSDTPTPQGDPRLQRINPGPKIATGYVDPCIVYLETTLPGASEAPLLIAALAQSSKEIRPIGGDSFLEMDEVVLFEWDPGVKGLWLFTPYVGIKGRLASRGNHFSFTADFLKPFPGYSKKSFLSQNKITRFAGKVKYLSEVEMQFFTNLFPVPFEVKSQVVFAKKLLEESQLDWPSIAEALTITSRMNQPGARKRKSLFRRLVSSVFKKKKSKPVHA
jgi:hypothetical protein